MKRKRWWAKLAFPLVGIIVILGLIIGGCAAPAPPPAKDKITIGFSRSLSGVFAPQAEGEHHSVILWSELVNERGGLYVEEYGKKLPVELVFYDDKSSEDEVVRIYERLITADKVDVLFPPSSTTMNKAAIAVMEKFKRPMVCTTSGLTQEVPKIAPKYWRMVEPGVEDYMQELIDLMAANKDEIKTVAIITCHDAYLLACDGYVVPRLEQEGFDIVLHKDYPLGITDLSGLLLEVQGKNPDAFLALSNVGDGILCMTQSIETGLKTKFYYNCLMTALGPFVQIFGEATEGVMAQANYAPELDFPSTPTPREFHDLYAARWEVPPDFLNAALGFQGAQVMEQAIGIAGTLDPEKIKGVLDTEEFMTIMGPVKFDGGLNVLRFGGVVQFQQGVGELIWPSDVATAELVIPKPPWPQP